MDNPGNHTPEVSAPEHKPDTSSSRTSLTAAAGANNSPQAEEPISYKYLEFSTRYHESDLPPPGTPDGSIPSAPDLNKYQDPMTWSQSRKVPITWLCCILTMITAYTPGAYSAGIDQYVDEFGVNRTSALAGITVFTLFFGIAPMFLAPFSELAGRRPVFVPAGIVYTISQVAAAVTRNFGGLIFSRVLAGTSSSVFSTMVSGVLADIYAKEDRNTAMTIFAGGTLFGTGLGPFVSGVTVQHLNWRWIWYIQIITCGTMTLIMMIVLPETRGSILLSRKAAALNKWYEAIESYSSGHTYRTIVDDEKPARVRWIVKADEERATLWTMIRISLVRPFSLFFTESVVFWFSLWAAFAWLVLYMTFQAVPLIFRSSHGFNSDQNGAVFSSICVGAVISVVLGVWQGHFASRSPRIPKAPEGRLYFACVQGALVPIGLFWLGWTSFPSVHWIVPVLAIGGPVTIGIFSTYLAVFNYLSDVYPIYASSANAAQSCARNLMGGSIPLFVEQMFSALTFQGGCSLLGGVAIILTFVPWVLVAYGTRIRARSKIATSLDS